MFGSCKLNLEIGGLVVWIGKFANLEIGRLKIEIWKFEDWKCGLLVWRLGGLVVWCLMVWSLVVLWFDGFLVWCLMI